MSGCKKCGTAVDYDHNGTRARATDGGTTPSGAIQTYTRPLVQTYAQQQKDTTMSNHHDARYMSNLNQIIAGCQGGGDLTDLMLHGGGADWLARKRSLLAPFASSDGLRVLTPDYACLGPKTALLDAAKLMHGGGSAYSAGPPLGGTLLGSNYAIAFDPSVIDTSVGIGGEATSFTILGAVIDWGIALQNYAPFDAQFYSLGFRSTVDSMNIDRKATIRFTGGVLGGRFFVPFAYRARSGMTFGQACLSTIRAQGGGIDPLVWPTPTLNFTLPASVSAAFSASALYLAAYSPQTADFLQAMNAASVEVDLPWP